MPLPGLCAQAAVVHWQAWERKCVAISNVTTRGQNFTHCTFNIKVQTERCTDLAPVTSTPTISCPFSARISSLSLIFPEQAAGLLFLTSVTQMQPTSMTGPCSLRLLGTPFFLRSGSPKMGMFPKLRPSSLSS